MSQVTTDTHNSAATSSMHAWHLSTASIARGGSGLSIAHHSDCSVLFSIAPKTTLEILVLLHSTSWTMSPPRYGSSEHVVAEEEIDQPRLHVAVPASQRRPRRDTNANAEKNRSHTSNSATSSVTTSRSFNSSESWHSSHESFGVRSEGRIVGRGGATQNGRVRGRPSQSTATTAPKVDEDEVIRRRQERKARSARLLLDLDDRQHHRRSSNDNDGGHKSSSERGHPRSAQISHRVDEHASMSADTRDGDTKERVRTRSIGSSKSRRRSPMGHVPTHTHDSRSRSSSASRRRSMDYAPPASSVNSATRTKTSLATGRGPNHSTEYIPSEKTHARATAPSWSSTSNAPQKDISNRNSSSSRSVRTYTKDSKQEHGNSDDGQRRSSANTSGGNDRVHLRAHRSASMGNGTVREEPSANHTGIESKPPSEASNRYSKQGSKQDDTSKDTPNTTSSENGPGRRRHSMGHHRGGDPSSSTTAPSDSVPTGNEQSQSETGNSSSSSRMLQVLRRASMQHSMSFRRLSISNRPPPPVREEDTSQKAERRDSINSTSSFLSLKEEILPPRTLRHDPNSSFRRTSLESEQCEVPPPTAPPQRNRTWSENMSSGGAILSMLGQGFRQETEAAEDNGDDISVASARSANTSSLPSRKSSIFSGFISNLDEEEEGASSSTSFFAKRKSSLESIGSISSTVNHTAAPCSSTSLPCVIASNDQGESSTESSGWMLGLKREAVDHVLHANEDQSATTSMRAIAETSVEKVNEVKQIGANIRQTIRSSIHQMAIPEVGTTYEVDTQFEPSTEKLHRTERGRRRHSTFMDMMTNISNEAEKTATSSSSDSFMSRASQRASMRVRNAEPSIGNSSRPASIVGSDVVGAFAEAAESMCEDKRRGARSKPPREEMKVFNPNNSKDDLGKELWDSGTFEVVDGLITLAHPDDEGKEHHPVFNFL